MKKFALLTAMCLLLSINTANAHPFVHETMKKPHFERVHMEHEMLRKTPPPPPPQENYNHNNYEDGTSTSVIMGSAIGSFVASLINN